MEPTLGDVSAKKTTPSSAEAEAAREFLELAGDRGLSLTGPDGLLKQFTKNVLETALNEEMTEHLGYEKHDPPGTGAANIRNGTRSKTVLTDTTGPVELDVPRDRAATFEPQIVKKRQRRLTDVERSSCADLPTNSTDSSLDDDRRSGESAHRLVEDRPPSFGHPRCQKTASEAVQQRDRLGPGGVVSLRAA